MRRGIGAGYEDIAIFAASQTIDVEAAFQHVATLPADQGVPALATHQHVTIVAAEERVISGATQQHGPAITAIEQILPILAAQDVALNATGRRVVARTTIERIPAVATDNISSPAHAKEQFLSSSRVTKSASTVPNSVFF